MGAKATAPDVDHELVARLRLVISRLARQLRQHAVGGLTPSQLSALATADRLGPVRPADLATAEAVSPPTMTKILAGLEARRMLERQADPGDRRACRLAVTRDGRRALDAIRRERTVFLRRRLAALSDGERRLLREALPVLEALVEGSGQ